MKIVVLTDVTLHLVISINIFLCLIFTSCYHIYFIIIYFKSYGFFFWLKISYILNLRVTRSQDE